MTYATRIAHHEANLIASNAASFRGSGCLGLGWNDESVQGVGVPGVVDHSEGSPVVHSQTTGWDAVPLGEMLRAGTDVPVFVENGAKTLGQAEMWFGAGRGAKHAVIVMVGTGVSAK